MDYFESGFTVREPAWHGKGYVADRYPNSWQEAREWAGLTWEPEARPVYALTGGDPDEFEHVHDAAAAQAASTYGMSPGDLQRVVDTMPAYEQLGDYQQIVRDDTGATLGVVSKYYQVITHAEMGEVVEAILDQPNVKYETAGVLHDGKAAWALAYLDEPVTLPGDNSVTLPYLALLTRHDGTGALKALSTSVRIVCANTFSASEAEGDRTGTAFTFSHSKSWRDRIEEARQTITGVRNDFQAWQEVAEHLVNVRVTREQAETFIREFIPSPPEGLVSDRVAKNVDEARQAVRTILAGPTCETVAGTGFGLVSAAGEYLDHYRSYRSMDSYYNRQLLRPEPLKTKAVNLVRDIVHA